MDLINLSEVLGITPFLQLVPKQDLAPLVSCSQIRPQALDPKDYLSQRARNLLTAVTEGKEENKDVVKGLMNRLSAKYIDFECSELDSVRFRRPVIAGESELQPKFPELPEIYNSLVIDNDLVSDRALVEIEGNLDTSVLTEDSLHLLDGSEALEKNAQHMTFYKDKFEKEFKKGSKNKKRVYRNDSGMARMTRRRISLDRSKLNDSRLDAFYNYLDNLTLELESQDENKSMKSESEITSQFARQVCQSDEHGAILTIMGLQNLKRLLSEIIETHMIADCSTDYLKEIQLLCVNTIRFCLSQANNSCGNATRRSIDASVLLLEILNSNRNNRELHMQSYIDCIVNTLIKALPEFNASDTSDFTVASVIDCLNKLSVNLSSNVADDRTLTQIEYMCVRAIFGGSERKASFQVRDAVAQTLCQIFKTYPSQRSFVINEVMSNISNVFNKKGLPREAQLSNGAYVSHLALFLVQMIESFEATQHKSEVESFLMLPKNDNPQSASSVKRVLIVSELSSIVEDAMGVIQQVIDYFLSKLSAAETTYKTAFTTLNQDLVSMMSLCEYPGAEFVISVIISTLMAAIKTQKVSVSEEPFLLELLGVFACNFLDLKESASSNITMGDNPSVDAIEMLSRTHMSIISHLREQASKHSRANETLHFQILKGIKYYKELYENSIRISKDNPYFTIISEASDKLSKESSMVTKALDFHLASLVNESIAHENFYDDASNYTRIYKDVILTTTLAPLYNEFLGLLTTALESNKIKLSAKAIRVLSPLVTKDPRILLNQKINSSISRVLSGGSALSKDAVIDLLGKYMFTSEDLITKYHRLIGERASEESISVRKRVLKIMRSVFERSHQIEVMTYACSRIICRLGDEEASIVSTSKANLDAMLFSAENIAEITEVIIQIFNSDSETRKLLTSLLGSKLHSAKAGGSSAESVKPIFDEAFGRISESTETSDIQMTVSAIAFVAALTECDSRLISQDQLISLKPFLVDGAFDKDNVSLNALRILRYARSNIRTLRSDFISSINTFLLKRLTKYRAKELHEAVQIVEEFSKFTSSSALTNAAISSMRLLLPYVSSGRVSIGNNELPKIRKILHLLGCFASYCDLESMRDFFVSSSIGLRKSESVVSLMSRYVLFFCRSDMEDLTKATALTNLLHVAAHHPRLFLSEAILNVLDTGLQSSAQRPKLEIVRGLSLFLTMEEEKLIKKYDYTNVSSVDPNPDFLSDRIVNMADSVCPSIIQRYINSILKLCLEDASEIGEAAVLFLQVVIKLGYANPKLCISTVIALQASSSKRIKRIGVELHSEIFQKHESLADRSYVEAIKQACEYSKRTQKDGHFHNDRFLRSVYRIVCTTYSAKKKFILSTIRLFNVNFANESLIDAITQRDIAVYLTTNLSVLNFTSMEEVYLILFHLNRFMTGEVLDLAERISKTIGSIDGKGMSVSNLQLLVVFSQTALAFISLRRVLVASFGVRLAMLDEFRPDKPDMELRQPPKITAFVDFPLSDLALDTKLSNPGSFGSLFTRLVQSTKVFNSLV